MDPSDATFRSPAWVVDFGRWIDRRGVGWSVIALVLATMATSTALAIWMLSLYPPEWLARGLTINTVVSFGISAPVSFVLCRLLVDLSRSRARLHQFANVDSLTGASSRRLLIELAPDLIKQSEVAAIVLLDVDLFKRINDRHGHATGDAVLRAVSEICRRTLRGGDLFARYGGEEFIALLPGADAAAGARVAERMRLAIAGLALVAPDGTALTVTASFGVASCDQALAPADALQQASISADKALYDAKRRGRDQVCLDPVSGARQVVRTAAAPDTAPRWSGLTAAWPALARLAGLAHLARLARPATSSTPAKSHRPATSTTPDSSSTPATPTPSVQTPLPGSMTAPHPARRRQDQALGQRPGRDGRTFAGDLPPAPWLLALENFVVGSGRVKATACSVLLSTVCGTALTLAVMLAGGMERFDVGVRFACTLTPIFSAAISWSLCSLIADMSKARGLLRRIAHFDGLTQAHTRPYFMDSGSALLARSATSAVVLLDIDDFKAINDRHGHDAGDRVLRAVSDTCRANLRAGDLFARYGGEEFAILLPDTTAVAAGAVIERMRSAIAALELDLPDSRTVRVTASFGITAPGRCRPGPADPSLEQALGAADRALYRAKRGGKNRVLFDLEPVGVAMSA